MSTCSRPRGATGCPRPAPSTAYLHTERSERPAGGDWIWKKRVAGVSSAPTRPSQGRRSSAMSSADEWMRNPGNLDVGAAVRGLPPLSLDLEDDAFFDINDIDDIDAPLTFGDLSRPSSSIDGSGQYEDDPSFSEILDKHFGNKPHYHPEKKPSALEPTAAVADAEASPSVLVPECPYAEKGCSRCRDKKAKGRTGTSLFFMARDKDFSSKIDAGGKESSLFLAGKDGSKGSICFPKKSRDGAWDGCFCKFVKMILGVPIRNKNNNTYYDQFKVNGNVRRECFDENGQVAGSRELWNAFRKCLRYVYLPGVEDEIKPPRPRAPKELKRREEVEQVIHWLKLVDDAHRRGESNKEELDGFFQSLHALLAVHVDEKGSGYAHRFLFTRAFRPFTGSVGYFVDDRPPPPLPSSHAGSNAFVSREDAKRRRLLNDVRGYINNPNFLGAQAFESPQ